MSEFPELKRRAWQDSDKPNFTLSSIPNKYGLGKVKPLLVNRDG